MSSPFSAAMHLLSFLSMAFLIMASTLSNAQNPVIKIIPVDSGWAGNSVNTVAFRKNSLTTWKDTQYISYYAPDGFVVIGKRKTGSNDWHLSKTRFKGNVRDAHNSISIIVDGQGYLHLAWDHHNTALKYARSLEPGAFDFATMHMTGTDEGRVTYPEFFRLPDGNLIFLYRDGESGRGSLILNSYNTDQKTWTRLQTNLIDGEDQRSAYWQACVDQKGHIHISWTWRESPDVASNHDVCYARSPDGGKTWTKFDNTHYALPITAETAEYIHRIPENSELINQTSMSTDANGYPYIATYWRNAKEQVPQYHVLYRDADGWKDLNTSFRNTAFSLSGGGTKSIPISRPQIVVKGAGPQAELFLVFRDRERMNHITLYKRSLDNRTAEIFDIFDGNVGSWEPTFDVDRWRHNGVLSLFVQEVKQADNEGITTESAKMVNVIELVP